MFNLIKQTFQNRLVYLNLIAVAVGSVVFTILPDSGEPIIPISIFLIAGIAIAIAFTHSDNQHTEETNQVPPPVIDLNNSPSGQSNVYTIGNYRFQVTEFVELFNKAKSQRDWNTVLDIGEQIVEGIKILTTHTSYNSGRRHQSGLAIIRLVAFLRVYLKNNFLLGSDIRKVMKLSVETYDGEVIGIYSNPNTFAQLEARTIRNTTKNKYVQQIGVDKMCFDRTYIKRLGRLA